ncbi:hypothetical protein H4696_009391 [Amycolatopsis lexingtonensis]|uniref:Uncharacterized protein n=1 Tax=Amycolatopsis lexingtonensis TaxID=218822 RepID=A0ABR9IGK6_9PSEU|nr:hypothetical protein [Amycolatopsis lexingtonensis]MBE1502291.1 hypothetical protein [Amycolatopsis lexingtonensis]
MYVLSGTDPVLVVGLALLAPAVRVIALVVALRGTDPRDRPAIIRALAELFRLLPRKRR